MGENQVFDVIVIGAGPAGLSAAILLNDFQLSTLVIGDGRSALNSALVGNYLGVTEPIEGRDFLAIARAQVQGRGVEIDDEKVVEFQHTDELITIVTEGNHYAAKRVILAGGASAGVPTAELAGLELVESDEPYTKKKAKVDERNRTSLAHVYAAGTLAGVASQAIIAAGSGAQTALNLVSDLQGKRVTYHQSPAKK